MFESWEQTWSDPQNRAVRSPTEFARKLKLNSVTFYDAGLMPDEPHAATLYYGDGGLFSGHFLTFLIGIDGQPTSKVEIAG